MLLDANTKLSNGINLDHAVGEFNLLSRQLRVQSESSSRNSEIATASAKIIESLHDIEKGSLKDDSTSFDLHAYLTSSNDANQAAGIKHKVWNPLSYPSSSTNYSPLESM